MGEIFASFFTVPKHMASQPVVPHLNVTILTPHNYRPYNQGLFTIGFL